MRSAAGPQGRRAEIEAPFRWRVIGEEWQRNLHELGADGRAFDLVVFTGDLGDWGHSTDYPAAVQFLREVCITLAVPLERLFVVPGNHDVDRARQHDAWKEVRNGSRRAPARAVSEWMAGGNTPPGFDAAWRDHVLERQAEFWKAVTIDLERPELAPARSSHGRLGYRRTIGLERLAVPVHCIGLDSAWLAGDDNDTGNLWLTEHQIELLGSEHGAALHGLRIALVHHGFADLADGARAKKLLAGRVDVVLHGHQHEPTAGSWMDPDHGLLVLAAGCLYEGDHQHRYPNACQVIDLQVDGDGRLSGVEIRFRGWSEGGLFWGDDALLYRAARNGRLGLRRQATNWVVGDLARDHMLRGHVDVRAPDTAEIAAVTSGPSSALSTAWATVSWQEYARISTAAKLLKAHGGFAGAMLGNYMLREPLGGGGSGVVFKAAHQTLGREVAVKLCYPLPGPRHAIIAATERAMRGLASLRHPGIIPILDFGYLETPGAISIYLVMELIDGDTLDVWCERLDQEITTETTRKRLDVAIAIAEALHAAHRCSFVGSLGIAETGVLHGDVKPSNILVRNTDARPVLIDFMIPDLQRLHGPGARPHPNWRKSPEGHYQHRPIGITEDFGTPGFMSPEQEVDGIVLPASDVFSLGVTFLDCLLPRDLYRIFPGDGSDAGIGQLVMTMVASQAADRPRMTSVIQQLRKVRRRLAMSGPA